MQKLDVLEVTVLLTDMFFFIPMLFSLLQNMLGWTKTSFHALLSTSSGLKTTLTNWPYMGYYAVWAHALNSEHAHTELGTIVN